MPQYQTPMDPYQAALQAEAELQARAIEAQKQAAARQQQQGLVNTGALLGGKSAMDYFMGGGSEVASSVPQMMSSGADLASPGLASTEAANAAWNAGADAATSAADVGSSTLGNVGGALGILKGGYDTFNAFKNNGKGIRTGLSELGAGAGWFAGGPVGSLVGAGIGNAIGWGAKKLGAFHKSTKQYEQERWGDLAKKTNDPRVASLYQSAHPEGDKGENWTPEVAEREMKEPTSMWGHLGMLQTFGSDYFDKMNEFQRYAATKAAIDNGLLKGDHGDIIVTDPERLKALAAEAYNNPEYQKLYNAWKASSAQSQMDGDTQMMPRGGADFDGMLSSALGSIQAQADQAVKDSKKQSILKMAAQPIDVPKLSSGTIRTGVQDLDNILGSVLG